MNEKKQRTYHTFLKVGQKVHIHNHSQLSYIAGAGKTRLRTYGHGLQPKSCLCVEIYSIVTYMAQ